MGGPPQAPSQRKVPGRRGYRWSIGLAITAVLLFVSAFLLNSNPIRVPPNIVERIAAEGQVEFEVEEGDADTWAIFSSSTDMRGCTHYPPGGGLDGPTSSWYHEGDYGGWSPLGVLDTSEPGIHRISCTDIAQEYALAGSGPLHAVKAQLHVTATIIFFIAPPLLLAAIVVAVVTTLRRRAAALRQP